MTDYLKAVEAGQTPDRDKLLARHPDLAADLAAFFAAESQVNRVAAPIRGDTDGPTVGLNGATGPGTKVGYFGDYELLEEIGRGGMGVVYKARQVTLNRTVALKMILAGQLAADADVQRFRAEAEAAARLDHPDIVPIFEVGEHEGQHYFSMEFVEGGSLAHRLAQGLLPPSRGRGAGGARSPRPSHYAHATGVVHRDLKPANVLLDERRHAAGDRLRPRQAGRGRRRADRDGRRSSARRATWRPSRPAARADVATAADVYCARGHPLRAAHRPAAVPGRQPARHAAAGAAARAGRRRDSSTPAIPRDLETICLKCLEKEPRKRYARRANWPTTWSGGCTASRSWPGRPGQSRGS